MASSESQLEAALNVFEGAGSDEERLVALLLITRCQLPSSDDRLLIAHRVGFNFIHRLLHSQSSSADDVPPSATTMAVSPYQRLGLGILTLYSSVPSLVQQVAFLEQLPDIVTITTSATCALTTATADDAAIISAIQVLTDTLGCLAAVGAQPGGPQQLLKLNCHQPVAELLQQLFATHNDLIQSVPETETKTGATADKVDTNDGEAMGSADADKYDNSGLVSAITDLQRLCMVLLTQLVQPQAVGACSADVMLRVLVTLAGALESCPSTLLFFSLDALSAAVAALAQSPATARKRTVCAAARSWQRQAAQTLTAAIQSQLGPELRGLVLRLAARLCRVLGAEWIFTLDDKDDKATKPASASSKKAAALTGHKAFQLLTQLAHVEMRVELEHDDLAVVLVKKNTLLACCYIVQTAIGHLLRLDLEQADVGSYEPVLTVAKAAVVAAATFIDQLAEARFGLPKPTNAADTESTIECDVVWELAQGCCMVVGAWMAEENSLLQAETVAVALYLCNVLGEGKPDMRDSAMLCLRSLITGLAGLAEHEAPRTTLLDNEHFLPAIAAAIATLSSDGSIHEQESQQDLVMLGYVVENMLLNTPRAELEGSDFGAIQQAEMAAVSYCFERHRAKSDYSLPVPVLESLLVGLWLTLHKRVGWAHYGTLDERQAAVEELLHATGQFWSVLNLYDVSQSLSNVHVLFSIVFELCEAKDLQVGEGKALKTAQQGCSDLAFVLREQQKGGLADLLSLVKLVSVGLSN